jgi:hypothetical protein
MEETQMAQYNERVDIVSNEILDAVRCSYTWQLRPAGS